MSTKVKSNAIVIIALIFGLAGTGMGAFSAIRFHVAEGPQGPSGIDGIDGIDGINGSLLVAVWDNLGSNEDQNFYINFSVLEYSRNEYFSLGDGNTSVLLNIAGWYRFSLQVRLYDLTSTESYFIYLMKNAAVDNFLAGIDDVSTELILQRIAYVYSDGNDLFRFYCWCGGSDTFKVLNGDSANDFVIEYIGP